MRTDTQKPTESKGTYRVKNWAQYNAGLIARGDITMWVDQSVLAPPEMPVSGRGRRSHWAIENGMHWTLDMAFSEDQCRVRVDNAAQNFAVLRRIAMNLLRQDRTSILKLVVAVQ
ncbi:hypothetical protein ABIC76_005027 [Ralstonia sp. 1138]